MHIRINVLKNIHNFDDKKIILKCPKTWLKNPIAWFYKKKESKEKKKVFKSLHILVTNRIKYVLHDDTKF
jgi:hypothetical protein